MMEENWTAPKRSAQDLADDAWYEAVSDAIHILGKEWYSDFTDAEDEFILAYADELATRPERER
jgi:hypothetical protein